MLPLWDYALKIYKLPGVKEDLLNLQDRYHIDVNSVIWCLWAARHGFPLEEAEAKEILGTTREMAMHTTRPLRAVRRFLSGPRIGFTAEALKALRDEVLRTEIMSEELVLRRLDAVTTERSTPVGGLDDMAARSEVLFTLARENVDTPIMIADEEGPASPMGLFRSLSQTVEDHGP
ncbi:MAG: TIGR02444 family protein [Pseudomonadota bacterium]